MPNLIKINNEVCLQVCALIVSTLAIRVPVEKTEDEVKDSDSADKQQTTQTKPIYYASDEAAVDSYLIPPDPHRPDDAPSGADAPATHLLPPAPNQQSEYYVPIEVAEQTDWYPIAETQPKARPINVQPHRPILIKNGVPIYLGSNVSKDAKPQKLRGPKSFSESDRFAYPIPSRQLEPPLDAEELPVTPPPNEQKLPSEDSKHKFRVSAPATDLELPLLKANQNFNPLTKNVAVNFHLNPAEPTLALHLTPPKPLSSKYKNPSKLYPKKYSGGFKPVPIPIAQFADDTSLEIPIARPLKPFRPNAGAGNDYYIPYDEKKIHQFDQAEQKRNIKQEHETKVGNVSHVSAPFSFD